MFMIYSAIELMVKCTSHLHDIHRIDTGCDMQIVLCNREDLNHMERIVSTGIFVKKSHAHMEF